MRLWCTLGLLAIGAIAVMVHAADTLTGAGATFPYPLYQKWFAAFAKKSPDISIAYHPVGSGAGIEGLARGTFDFAGSDIPLRDEHVASFPAKVWQIPAVVGGVVPIYHLEGIVDDIRFTPEILAGIYLGKIKRWNDPALRAANRGVNLPAHEIVVVHRSDRSGTTYIFTRYLAQVNETWKSAAGSGDTIAWPVGIGSEGNDGVAKSVAGRPDTIGYVEFIYALENQLDYGLVRNRAGQFVQANLASLQAAADDFTAALPDDFGIPLIDAPGRSSYPIASFTYLLVPGMSAKHAAILDFLRWMLTSGQKQAAALGYAALPPPIAAKALDTVGQISGLPER